MMKIKINESKSRELKYIRDDSDKERRSCLALLKMNFSTSRNQVPTTTLFTQTLKWPRPVLVVLLEIMIQLRLVHLRIQ